MIVENIKLSEWNEAVFMTAYVPSIPSFSEERPRKSVLICPGGAFVGHTEREMETVALQFVAEGYCAFVLSYSIGAGLAMLPAPLFDIARAIEAIKSRVRQWAVDPESIFMMGFSSGAYVVALYANLWHETWFSQGVNLPSEMIKPLGAILAYPILDLELFAERIRKSLPEQAVLVEMMFSALFNTPHPTEEHFARWRITDHLSENTLPTWIWSWSEDIFVDREQTEAYYQLLRDKGVEAKMDIFSGDLHGSGLYFGGDRMKRGTWFDQLSMWTDGLKEQTLPK